MSYVTLRQLFNLSFNFILFVNSRWKSCPFMAVGNTIGNITKILEILMWPEEANTWEKQLLHITPALTWMLIGVFSQGELWNRSNSLELDILEAVSVLALCLHTCFYDLPHAMLLVGVSGRAVPGFCLWGGLSVSWGSWVRESPLTAAWQVQCEKREKEPNLTVVNWPEVMCENGRTQALQDLGTLR